VPDQSLLTGCRLARHCPPRQKPHWQARNLRQNNKDTILLTLRRRTGWTLNIYGFTSSVESL